ncbi:MAG: N-acetylmuramoyl-L-alanine amidase, partial [Phycicoccus sp.]
MARMPGVPYRGVSGPAMVRYDLVVLHTIVGRDPADAAHFSVGGQGETTQSRDTAVQSAACLNGNPRCIAIETEDRGPDFPDWDVNDGRAVPAWTPAQMEATARILVWCHQTHGIPLTIAPDSRPTSRGIAWHRMGVPGGNWAGYAYSGVVPGGELWTKAAGKVCPGDRRISQVPAVVARAQQLLAGGDQDMQADEREWLRQLHAVFSEVPTKTGRNAGVALSEVHHVLGRAFARTGRTIGDVVADTEIQARAIAAAVGPLQDDEANAVARHQELLAAIGSLAGQDAAAVAAAIVDA